MIQVALVLKHTNTMNLHVVHMAVHLLKGDIMYGRGPVSRVIVAVVRVVALLGEMKVPGVWYVAMCVTPLHLTADVHVTIATPAHALINMYYDNIWKA